MLRRVALAVIATLAICAAACSSPSTSTTSTKATSTTVPSTSAGPPAITGLKPASAPVGIPVSIKGTNLAGATKVTFNGVPATIIKDTASKIKVKVPAGATTGKIEIVTPKGQAQTATAFRVTT